MEKGRLTVTINKKVIKELKLLAVREERTLSYYVEKTLIKLLTEKKEGEKSK